MAQMMGFDAIAASDEEQFFSQWTLREAIAKAADGSVLKSHPVEPKLTAACRQRGRVVNAEQFTALVDRLQPDAHLAVVLNLGSGAQ